MPVSTLKLNFRKLKHLGLISHSFFEPVTLTDFGKLVFRLVSQGSSIGRAGGCKPSDLDSTSSPETFEKRWTK